MSWTHASPTAHLTPCCALRRRTTELNAWTTLAMRPHSHARLRHRATAPPPCDLTARTAPPPPPLTALLHAPAASPGTPHHSTTRCTGSPPSSMNAGHSMLLLLLFSPLAHPLVQAAPRTATRQLLTTVDTSSAQPTAISGARLPALALPRLARHSPHPRHSSPTPHPHSRPRKQGVNISKRG